MSVHLSCARAAAAVAASSILFAGAPASATVLFGTYAPSDTAVTVREYFLPVNYRSPSAAQSFDSAVGVGAPCTPGCRGFNFQHATSEFVAPSDFLAARVVLPVSDFGNAGNMRIGVSFEHLVGAAWQGLGGAQIETALVPNGGVLEVELPFGTSGARFIDYNYQPIQFEQGDTYRIRVRWGAGASGAFFGYLSDLPATPGQTVQSGTATGAQNLNFQLAFALTDGGSLAPPPVAAGVPEPATWAAMICGLFGAGAVLRRGRRTALRAA